jgi:hypothetical protein
MIVLVAGLPAAHFNRIQQLAPRIFGKGVAFLAAPLRPDEEGFYRPGGAHADRLVEVLVDRVRQAPRLIEGGAGVLLLRQEGVDPTACADHFRPFALIRTVTLPRTIETRGRPGEMSANAIADALREAFRPLAKAVGAMATEVTTRLNRTPLLLPLRNFRSHLLRPTVAALWASLSASADPAADIAAACRRIEARHPYGRIGGSNRRCFEDDKRIQFRSPAKAHHGMAVTTDPPHDPFCFLNGNLRLGGRFAAGFHYDCIKDLSERRRELPLKGRFRNCHDGRAQLTGKPHVNIAPNDFCRV